MGTRGERGCLRPFPDYGRVVREIGAVGVLDNFDEPNYTCEDCAVRG